MAAILLSGVALGALTMAATAQQAQRQVDETELSPVIVEGGAGTGAGEENANGAVNGIVAKKTATAGKTGRAIVKTPQTVNVVGRQEMEQRGAATVTEGLRYTPGVVAETRPTTRYDLGFIRGFGGLQNWFDFVDGMRMMRGVSYNAPSMDAWNIERIEVLKGPASVLYGQIMPGGLINQVTKKPLDHTQREVQLTVGAPGRLEAAFDFTGPVPGAENFKYRLVGLGRYQESNIDFNKTQRMFIAPSLTWDATPDTSLTVYAGYMHDPKSVYPVFLPARGTVMDNGVLPSIPYDFNVEGQGYSKFDRKQAWAGYELTHNFSDSLKFTQKLRYMDVSSDFQGLAVTGLNGSNILRTPSHVFDASKQVTIDNQLQYEFDTGPVKHTLLGGLDYQYISADRYLGQGAPNSSPIDYLNPNYSAPAVPVYTRYDTLKRSQTGVYLQDQLDIGRLAATLGGRYDAVSYDIDAFGYNAMTGVKTPAPTGSVDKSVSDFTWNAGAAYLFDNGIAPYASYATSFEVNAGTGVGGKPFEPITARQFEVGVRYQPTAFNGMLTLSYFDIEQQNVMTASTTTDAGCSTSPCQFQLGKVRSNGVEIEGKGEIAPGLDLIASYAYVHARVTEDTNPYLVGVTPAGIPKHQAALWTHYTFDENSQLAGLGLGAGVRYIGASKGYLAAGTANVATLDVPSYALVDAAMSYDFGAKSPELKGLRLTVSASNLFDKKYVASCGSSTNPIGSCYYGTGREVKATLGYKW